MLKTPLRPFIQRMLDAAVGHWGGQRRAMAPDSSPNLTRIGLNRRLPDRRRTDQYLNSRTEQDHRGIRQRYHVMLGFGSFASAARFCAAFDALRQCLRARRKCGEVVPLAVQRQQFAERWEALVAELAAA